ncbi:MAG: gamma-glutamyltransferase [Nitrospinota bacterium]|nr:gamma-glutamyltransferase [Nitrospinota bacterium]
MYGIAATRPEAVNAGMCILEQGGNAFDAAITVSLTLGVTEPFYSGVGGGGVSLLWNEKEKKISFIDFGNECSSQVTSSMFDCDKVGKHLNDQHNRGYLSILVPGLLKGLEIIYSRFSSMDWETLFKDPIKFARNGFEVNSFYELQSKEKRFTEMLEQFSHLRKIHSKDGTLHKLGSFIKQPELAESLNIIAKEGSNVFYNGEIGHMISEEMNNGKGPLSFKDLVSYRIREPKPLEGAYDNLKYFTAPLPSCGLLLIQILNLFELQTKKIKNISELEISKMLAKAMKLAFKDRFLLYGDPKFLETDFDNLLTKSYAAKLINSQKEPDVHIHDSEIGSTTHFTIIDKYGNAVCQTQTLGAAWGSGVIVPGTGILLNNHTNWMDPRPNKPNNILPGKRPVAGFAPTLIFKENKLQTAIGSPGSYRIPTAIAQVILNQHHLKMNLADAINKNRMHCDIGPLYLEGEQNRKLEKELQDLKFNLSRKQYPSHFFGGIHAIEKLGNGKLEACGDLRRNGTAMTKI